MWRSQPAYNTRKISELPYVQWAYARLAMNFRRWKQSCSDYKDGWRCCFVDAVAAEDGDYDDDDDDDDDGLL